MRIRSYIANPKMTGENRLPARSLLIPAQKPGVTHKNFTESDRIALLNGTWRFSYREADTDEAFYLPEYDDRGWDDLPVPSMWQFRGYGTCFYPNVRYCFPFDPPYIHGPNPVGLYRRAFQAEKTDGRVILRFGGVDNAYFVWLNGEYVGFSKGSRIAAEFDVTDKMRAGENLLAVKVYTYSDASYLENQDMLMASGIFRDVMLIRTGKNALWDYTLLSGEDGFRIRYSCTADGGPASLRFSLADMEGHPVSRAEAALTASGEVFLPIEEAVTWNAERPYLYTLTVEIVEDGAVTEVHTKRAGIAKSEIRGHHLLLNGQPITLKGVNRHENNAKAGRAITAEQIERELKDIKATGLNAIRCSHYTNQPVFYELASELGIYVMDEADAETHGAETTGDQGALNKDPAWFDAFFDRFSRMVALDKNETCVNIWSTGNECGAGTNHTKCVEWLMKQDTAKPVNTASPMPEGATEVFSYTGYMPMSTLRNYPADAAHPLLMVEYAHAMGNSPGGLEDIWNWVYENEQCCGGYVWEFKSHGFYTEGKDGRPRYLYGGDFPDVYHWSNFSLDGYHTSDGTPKPTWDELREVSAPVHVRWSEGGAEVKNTYDFTPLDGFVLRWSVRADGAVVKSGEYALDGIGPREWRTFALPITGKDIEGLCGIVTADCEFYRDGRKIAHKQKILADHPAAGPVPVPFRHTVETWDCGALIRGEGFSVEIRDGLLAQLERDGAVLFDEPMRLNCWRAPTDNDGIIGFAPRLAGMWKDRLIDTMVFGCYDVNVADGEEAVTVTAEGKYLPFCHDWGFDTILTYRITAGGEIGIAVKLTPCGKDVQPEVLPRVGVVFTLPGDYDRCAWLGRGPGDSYPDRHANAPIGLWEDRVERMNFLYDVPQETGNHEDCRRVTVSGDGRALTVTGKFSFSFHDFTLENLTNARHADELEKSRERYLYIDHRHRGLGSNSCGPQPEAEYELPMGAFEWDFRISR